MSVHPQVSFEAVRAELEAAAPFAAAAGILLDTEGLGEENLRFHAVFLNRDGERFMAEFDCRDFPLYPPTIEFVSEDRSQRGLATLYPAGFHPLPCICMRYNRKAYTERGGPHGDWRLLDWHLPTPGGGAIDSLALVLSDLHAKIGDSSGRLG